MTPPSKPSPPNLSGDDVVTAVKGLLTGKKDAFVFFSKSENYFVMALLVYVASSVASAYRQLQTVQDLLGAGALSSSYAFKQVVLSLIVGVFFAGGLYLISKHQAKVKSIPSFKGFFTVYMLILLPTLLSFLPFLGLVGAIWFLVLFFKMMKALFDFGFWKSLGFAVVVAIAVGILSVPLVAGLGLSGFEYGSYDLELNF